MSDVIDPSSSNPAVGPSAAPSGMGMFGRWLTEGGRSALFMRPRWQGLRTGPAMVAVLILAFTPLTVLLQRYYIPGAAGFHWRAFMGGWFYTALLAWLCYLLRPQRDVEPVEGAPDAAHLFSMAIAQLFFMSLITGALLGALVRAGKYNADVLGLWGLWVVWLLPLTWSFAAQWTLLWRTGSRRGPGVLMLAMLSLLIGIGLASWFPEKSYWHAKEQPSAATPDEPEFTLTQEMMEAQPRLLEKRLRALKPQRAGTIDLYALTFAPYAYEDVFRRESEMVASVMAARFDAGGRTLQLVNNNKTVEQWPWATPLNLRRAIAHIGKLMNRDEDVLFLHLTSHGAADGQLSAAFWPMNVAAVTPAQLKSWLDEAGIKNRVISISACFSGSWIAPLANEQTLIMTAADADHTSYGCGKKSDLTFFGRAMFDEQLRNNTLSFEEAHRAARIVIKKREEEAGKSDGYSNPQIKAGSAIRARLERLQTRLSRSTGSRAGQ